MIIRQYLPKDYDGICEISKHIWDGHDYLPRMINKYYEDKYSIPVVMEIDEEIVSVANTRLITENIAWFEAMRTHPKVRGKGYATLLTQEQIKNAKFLGASKAQLLTSIENIATRKMMEKLNFEETHQYYLWGWEREDFMEYKDPNIELDREGKLISVKHLHNYVTPKGQEYYEKITIAESIDEVVEILKEIAKQGLDDLIVGDYQTYPVNSFEIERWIQQGKIYKIQIPPAIISIQESKESIEDNIAYSVGVTSPNNEVIEAAMLYAKNNFKFNYIELMFNVQLRHALFSIEEYRFRLMTKHI